MSSDLQILIRVDAYPEVGFGHLIRCMALAQAIEQQGAKVHFIGQLCPSAQSLLAGNVVMPFTNEEQASSLAKQYDGVILDSYQLNGDDIATYTQASVSLLLDDEDNRGSLAVGMLTNPIEGKAYQHVSGVKLIGSSYAVLRQQFCVTNFPDITTRKRILIMMGASDVAKLTLAVCELLLALGYSKRLDVIIGPAIAHADEIVSWCQLHQVNYFQNVKNMAQRMQHCCFAVTAAGGSLFELAKAAIPCFAYAVAPNQLPAVQQGKRQGWLDFEMVSNGANLDNTKLKTYLEDTLLTPSQLVQRSQAASAAVDGQGAKRVISRFIAQIIANKG